MLYRFLFFPPDTRSTRSKGSSFFLDFSKKWWTGPLRSSPELRCTLSISFFFEMNSLKREIKSSMSPCRTVWYLREVTGFRFLFFCFIEFYPDSSWLSNSLIIFVSFVRLRWVVSLSFVQSSVFPFFLLDDGYKLETDEGLLSVLNFVHVYFYVLCEIVFV